MKALTVRQPWAWAIFHAGKGIENRSRPTRFRGPLLIHAGLSRDDLGQFAWEPVADKLVLGAVIGLVDVVGCKPLAELADDPWAEGPWCWMLANPRPLAPIPWKGVLGMFDVPDEILEGKLPTKYAGLRGPMLF